jgi:hypothetical protein
MKRPLCFLVFALACPACNTPPTSREASNKVAQEPVGASEPAGVAKAQAGAPDALDGQLALLQKVDLSAALSDSSMASGAKRAPMEGFYGPNNYRVSFFFTKVVRDKQRPGVYHIWGKNRYKKIITPFTGTCTLKQLTSLADTADLQGP